MNYKNEYVFFIELFENGQRLRGLYFSVYQRLKERRRNQLHFRQTLWIQHISEASKASVPSSGK